MSFSVEVDHWPAQAACNFGLEPAARLAPSIRWDRAAMTDLVKAGVFEEALKQRVSDLGGRPCQDAERFICTVREVGMELSTLDAPGPRKAWISDSSFQLMREAWRCKDLLRDARVWLRSVHVAPVFWAWLFAVGLRCGSSRW